MKEAIKYKDWPEMVKINTAFSTKNGFLFKDHRIILILGYMVLILGVLYLISGITQNKISRFFQLLDPIGILVIGLSNVVSGYSMKWITNHSSWEERFENNSSTLHKIISGIITVVIILSAYILFIK